MMTGIILRNQMTDKIQELAGDVISFVGADEIQDEISLEIEAERKTKYGKEFGSWG